MKKLISVMLVILMTGVIAYGETCTTAGAIEKKYTPQGDCEYKTETRTCCENKEWSGWDKACEKEGCFNGTEWESEPNQDWVSIDSPVMNRSAIANNAGSIVNLLDSSFSTDGIVRRIINVEYKRNNCTCTSAGWKCRTSFQVYVLESSARLHHFNNSGNGDRFAGCAEEKLTEDIAMHYWEWMPEIFGGRPDGSKRCDKNTLNLQIMSDAHSTSFAAYKVEETCQKALEDILASKKYYSTTKKCGVVGWETQEVEESKIFRSSHCWAHYPRVSELTCKISPVTLSKSSDDNSSWFGE